MRDQLQHKALRPVAAAHVADLCVSACTAYVGRSTIARLGSNGARLIWGETNHKAQKTTYLKERMWLSSEMMSWRVTRTSSSPTCCITYRQLATTCGSEALVVQ